ncbi:diguanylate cyclase domain-containing protein [Cellvibrio mixtus]|uniref:diguanylate cyclase domain-containing protein n=1 Tax=Cellvibrio mixtus TaxID=39650 RepID=UPI0005880418|nr:diguanylate cyclase [Cellvibrio mixtus]
MSTHLISRQVADKICYALNLAFVIDDLEIHISCSIGIALYSQDGNDKNTLIKHADSAIYMAKSLGKNCVKHFSDID